MLFEVFASGDMQLTFKQFENMVHSRIGGDYSKANKFRLHTWFKALDADGNGRIDAAEFLYAVHVAPCQGTKNHPVISCSNHHVCLRIAGASH